MRKYKKAIAFVIVTVIFVSLGLYVYLNYHYAYTRPGQPQADIQRTYPLNIHGTIVYLTEQEDSQLKWIYRTMIASIIIAILYTYFYKPFNQDKNRP